MIAIPTFLEIVESEEVGLGIAIPRVAIATIALGLVLSLRSMALTDVLSFSMLARTFSGRGELEVDRS